MHPAEIQDDEADLHGLVVVRDTRATAECASAPVAGNAPVAISARGGEGGGIACVVRGDVVEDLRFDVVGVGEEEGLMDGEDLRVGGEGGVVFG